MDVSETICAFINSVSNISPLVPPGKAAIDAGAANLGLKDQRLALEWVQKNIGYFGGDARKVQSSWLSQRA